MTSKKYYIKTFGCQMNVSDSERIAAFLEQHAYSLAQKIEEADLAIFNTCGVKQTAENRAYSMIHNLKKLKQADVKIVMTGCLAHRADVQKRMQKSVDLFFQIKDFKIFENWLIENCLEIGNWKLEIPAQTAKVLNQEEISYLSIEPKRNNNFQAFVPVMTGCNNFCSYCVVPYARGREVSRNADEIIEEVKCLVKQGYKHIMLLGQNVNSYKSKAISLKETEVNFSYLLKKLDKIPGKFWLSYVSSHPKDFSDELIETTAKLKKVCEWIHLPVQAGNDEVLSRMNRKYTQGEYLKLVRKIRASFKKHKPDVSMALTSDLIVGFPGETKKQFADSEKVMQKGKYDMVFFGQFSPRPGTVAFKMKDDVSAEEKSHREFVLNEILKKTTFANNKKYVGQKIEVLIENEKDGICYGKTRTQKNIKIQTNKKNLVGKFAKVTITRANVWNLEGEIK